jgi:hypothetical protein
MKMQSGRSMVEMLGVLAIIGVLSVGAIAGYSKAMMKYRLNKHAEAANMLINNVLQMKDKLERPQKGQIMFYNNFFHKMNILPEGIIYNSSNNKLVDAYFKEEIDIYIIVIQTLRVTNLLITEVLILVLSHLMRVLKFAKIY